MDLQLSGDKMQLPGFLKSLWGNLSNEELKKFGLLSIIITLILGNYWMLRVLKNPFFEDFVGMEYQPYAKICSMFVVAFVVLIYSKLVDLFDKKRLFDILCTFYAGIFIFLSFATAFPSVFSLTPDASLFGLFTWFPGKAIGWISYFAFESSSLLIALFWAFVASVTKPESAKKGYGMIVSCIQIGTIAGPALVINFVPTVGAPAIVAFGGMIVLSIPLLVRLYMRIIPEELSDSAVQDNKKPKTGFLEGLKLIGTRPYVLGILIVSTIYEIIGTVLEFQMNMIAKEIFPTRDLFAVFQGKYGMSINFVALCFALLGTSFFMRKFGLRACLIVFPTIVGVVLLGLLGFNFTGASSSEIMWALFFSMIAVKGLSYALNNPTKEVMYIPTTKDIRFKAKGWIESFGGRTSKGAGSVITASFANSLSQLLLFGTLISLGIVGFWIVVANMLGKRFNRLQSENKIVE